VFSVGQHHASLVAVQHDTGAWLLDDAPVLAQKYIVVVKSHHTPSAVETLGHGSPIMKTGNQAYERLQLTMP